jgi:hypothetical protein
MMRIFQIISETFKNFGFGFSSVTRVIMLCERIERFVILIISNYFQYFNSVDIVSWFWALLRWFFPQAYISNYIDQIIFLWMQAKERRGKSLSKEKQKAETSAPVVNQ